MTQKHPFVTTDEVKARLGKNWDADVKAFNATQGKRRFSVLSRPVLRRQRASRGRSRQARLTRIAELNHQLGCGPSDDLTGPHRCAGA
jgi:hypothetical protein